MEINDTYAYPNIIWQGHLFSAYTFCQACTVVIDTKTYRRLGTGQLLSMVFGTDVVCILFN